MTEENLGIANLLNKIPLASRPDDEDRRSPTESKKSSRASTPKQKDEFNNEEIQRKMSGVINELSDTKETQPTTSEEPQSFTLEQTRSIESASDDDFFRPKAPAVSEEVRPASRQSKGNGLDETRRFGVTSPKAPSSARQSPVPAQPSSRAPSRLSQHSTFLDAPTPKETSPRSNGEPPAIVAQSRKSSSKGDFLATKTDDDDDRERLIKPGEQLQIPTETMDNERIHSPPPSPSAVRTLAMVNPLHVAEEPKRKKSTDTTSVKTSSRRSSQTQVETSGSKTHSRKPSQTSNQQIEEKPLSRKSSTSEKAKSSSSRRQSEEKLETNRSAKSNSSQRSNEVQPAASQKSSRRASSIKSPRNDEGLKLDLTPLERESKTPTEENPSQRWVDAKEVPSIFTSEDEKETHRDERPKSPNAQQIDERNEIPPAGKRKSGSRPVGRSSSADSFSGIPIVDDQSIGSNSDKNTEVQKRKKRVVRSKKKDVETNTENAEDPDPVNVNVTVLVKKYPGENAGETPKKKKTKATPSPKVDDEVHRATQSDSEQIVTDKQKKRRRPKRISRTTQTYECVFRRMAQDEHQELRPNGETEKSVQTRRSQLRPRTRSPSKPLPIYLSTDAFRIEEILPKQFPQPQRNVSKTSIVARSSSPPTGKILILRPTLPIHHADAVNVQRVCLQYAIDLMPKETSRTGGKLNPLQQLEQTNQLPSIRSPTASSTAAPISSHRPTFRDKPVMNKTDTRRHPFGKNGGGAV